VLANKVTGSCANKPTERITNGIKAKNIIGNIPSQVYKKPKGGPRRDRL
jgi:hypothetical protein